MTSSDDEEVQLVGLKSKRKTHTVEEKMKAIELSRKKTVAHVAQKLSVAELSIYRWRKQVTQLKELSKKRKHLSGGGRPLKSDAFDEKVFQLVTEQRGKKLKVSRHRIIGKAREFLVENPVVDGNGNALTASYGWAVKFMKRHNLVLRRRTTTCQKPPSAFVEKVIGFVRYVEELRKDEAFDAVYAADETAVALDQTSGLVVDERGAKEVCKREYASENQVHRFRFASSQSRLVIWEVRYEPSIWDLTHPSSNAFGARSYAWQTIAYKLHVPDRALDLRRMWRGWLHSYVNYRLRTTNRKPKYYNNMLRGPHSLS